MPFVSMGLYTADKRFYLADVSSSRYSASSYYVAKVRDMPLQRRAGGQHGGLARCAHGHPAYTTPS